jgi:hypothetical protein
MQIPFDQNGNMLTYVNRDGKSFSGGYIEEVVWKENYEFADTFHITNYVRGRSSIAFELISCGDGKRYYMFVSDFVEMVQSSVVEKGVVSGTWTFCKKGCNYGMKLVIDLMQHIEEVLK